MQLLRGVGGLLLASIFGQPASAVESQLLSTIRGLPAELVQAFPCGQWSAGGAQGYYRVVIAAVYGGVGSEVYLQRVQQASGARPELTVIETITFPQLNDDHGQYSVSAARCRENARHSHVELSADYEHDVGNIRRAIGIELRPPYRVSNRRVLAPSPRAGG